MDTKSIFSIENYKNNIDDSIYEIFNQYLKIINKYNETIITSIHVNKHDYFKYVYLKGIESLTYIFNMLIMYTKNLSLTYHHWSRESLIPDSNNIPSPLKEKTLTHEDLSLLLVPALAIDQEGYRLGYGGGYFDRLRQNNEWRSIPSFIIISQNCVSERSLPRDSWDIPFNGWINENGLHQIKQTK